MVPRSTRQLPEQLDSRNSYPSFCSHWRLKKLLKQSHLFKERIRELWVFPEVWLCGLCLKRVWYGAGERMIREDWVLFSLLLPSYVTFNLSLVSLSLCFLICKIRRLGLGYLRLPFQGHDRCLMLFALSSLFSLPQSRQCCLAGLMLWSPLLLPVNLS